MRSVAATVTCDVQASQLGAAILHVTQRDARAQRVEDVGEESPQLSHLAEVANVLVEPGQGGG